jgi:hypothetical protein
MGYSLAVRPGAGGLMLLDLVFFPCLLLVFVTGCATHGAHASTHIIVGAEAVWYYFLSSGGARQLSLGGGVEELSAQVGGRGADCS